MEEIKKILQEKNVLSHNNQEILIAKVRDSTNGLQLAQEICTAITDKNTLLLLSGGRTPKDLYSSLAHDEMIDPGSVGMVDERYGKKFHKHSNEKMLKDTGFLRYLEMRGIDFFPILTSGKTREETAESYEDTLRELVRKYQQSIAILGIGLDGHTAGIAGNRRGFTNPLFSNDRKSAFVSEFDDNEGMFKERITMTFIGLEHMDVLIVLVFGDDKKDALDLVFSGGSEEEIPGRFFTRPSVAKRTLFITDQNV